MPKGTVSIHNSDNHDLFVTLNDMNMDGNPVVTGWQDKRLNSTGPDEPADVELDGTGFCQVSWSCKRADDATVTGQSRDPEVKQDGGVIYVSTN